MSEPAHPRGLSIAEAERRLASLPPLESESSRSVASIVAGNVFTLFNAIILVFFILVLSLGLFADALFGLIAALNSYIGIRQELKAKRTLDELALLVAPSAKTIRDGRVVELRADEVVPGDVVRVEPGDQLVADGEVIESRGLTVDESLLTGEADGIGKRTGDRLLSGSFCISGSSYYELDAVRDDSYAEKLAGEARQFRHPPSPLQLEVNRVLWATTWVMAPLAVILLVAMSIRSVEFTEAAQTATAGLITMIPEGLVLLMSVTLAVAAVRLARRRLLVQQMAATEGLAAVDTICVDKTGTLTDGSLELVRVEPADPDRAEEAERALSRFAASAGERNRTLETIAERFPGRPRKAAAEVPFSSEWKWSGLTLDGRSYVLGAPDVLAEAGALTLPPGLERALAEHTSAGRRVVAFGEASGPLPSEPRREPPPPIEPRALVVLSESLRPDAADTVAYMRQQEVDLKLISGDARETVTAVAQAVGVPPEAGVIEGSSLPDDPQALAGRLCELAEAHADWPMPGYTHLQRAQPVYLGHHLLAYVWMLLRDGRRFESARGAAGELPLGSGALAGLNWELDREAVASELGFERVAANSIDAVASRDSVLDYLAAASICATHLSRLGAEIVLWASEEFGFCELADEFTSGSSIMPQKKNPDAAELLRAKAPRIGAGFATVTGVLHGLPLAYSKDLQEDKEALFDACDNLELCLEAAAGMLAGISFRRERMAEAAADEFLAATDVADLLVRKGMPFREAHGVVGSLVRHALERGASLSELQPDELRQFSELLDGEYYEVLSGDRWLESKRSQGGTASERVAEQLAAARAALERLGS